jgi:hypothetical protein
VGVVEVTLSALGAQEERSAMTSTTLYRDLLAAIQEHSGMERDRIREAGEHGADAGWPGFTYTTDGAEFTRANRELVWSLLTEEADEFGFENVPAFVASFTRADMADTEDGFDCLLSWYALETAGRWVADHADELREADEDALRESGEAAGRAAGSWVSDGNSTEEHCREVLRMIEECEFEIPSPLSGEYADGWTAERVFEDSEVQRPEEDDAESELLTTWEDAYREGYEAQAAEDARGFLPERRTHRGRCYSCGDEWTELTPPAICPECHSTNVAEVARLDDESGQAAIGLLLVALLVLLPLLILGARLLGSVSAVL